MESRKRKIRRLEKGANACSHARLYFRVRHPSEYSSSFPSFREPTEIGNFSLDGQRCFQPDDRQMKYLVKPTNICGAKFDLNKGYDKVVRKNQGRSEKLDNILHWILANKGKVFAAFTDGIDHRFSADFVCYRGLLTQLICTIYENKDDWIICATKFLGTIYLCEFYTQQRIAREQNQTERQKLMSSWGYKFEQFMNADKPDGEPDVEAPVNENEEFCIALKGRLDNNTLLFAAEVDCVKNSTKKSASSTKRYVELKTSRKITTERQDRNFCRYKLLKWWAQSFLIGIPKVVCGFRDDDGIVQEVRKLRTKDIPKMAENLWSPSAGMNFCSKFLQFVKDVVVKDDPNVVYKFSWRPGQDVKCEELSPAGEYQILPEWYTCHHFPSIMIPSEPELSD